MHRSMPRLVAFAPLACLLLIAGCNGQTPATAEVPLANNNSSSFTITPSAAPAATPGTRADTTSVGSGSTALTATVSNGRFTRAEKIAVPAGAPASYTYPYDFYAFDISGLNSGESVTLTLDLPTGPAPTAYVKCLGSACAVYSSAAISGQRVQLLLTDGGSGDSDGLANGVIRDPGAPAVPAVINPPPPPPPPPATTCTLPAGQQTLLQWDGTVAPGLGGSSTDSKAFTLPTGCSIASMTVSISWQPLLPGANLEDLDLALTPPAGSPAIAPSAAGNTLANPQESITVNNPVAGSYTAVASGFISASTPYHGIVNVFVTSSKPQCNDGLDNDGDGKVDFGGDAGDPGCTSADDDSELDAPPAAQCSDGLDNDGDGKIDFGGENSDPGCSSALDNDETDPVQNAKAARVVVADIDSGINPYHIFYNPCTLYGTTRVCSPIYPAGSPPSSVTPAILAEFGIDEAHQIRLTRTGNFAADFAADKAKWDAIRSSNPERDPTATRPELYWFVGTNIIAASYDLTGQMILPDTEDDTHGVGTSAAVLTANPEAIVLFVESGDQYGEDHAEQLGFLHPMVDIVTTSYGAQVPLAGVGIPIPFVTHSFDSVVTMGKLHFSSAANSPDIYTSETGTSGPWWTVNIAGIEESSSGGRTTLSGYFTDFVSDFTQTLPYCMACEDGYNEFVAGTSFATPRSAGVASRVLLEARRRMGHSGGIVTAEGKPVLAATAGKTLSTWQLRRALEQGAYTPGLADYSPLDGLLDISLPVLDLAPWLITGWGEISALPAKSVVEQTLGALGFGTLSRTKPAGTCEFQTLGIQRRKLFWDQIAVFFNTYEIPASDPFIYCGSALQAP